MSETTTDMSDDTEDEPTYGVNVQDVIDRYNEAYNKAHTEAEKQRREVNRPLDEASTAVRRLFGTTGVGPEQTDAVVRLLRSMTLVGRQSMINVVTTNRDKALEAADEKHRKELATDPLVKFVSDLGHRTGHTGDTNSFLEALPMTLEEMRELADYEQWCITFEEYMLRAVEAGLLPRTTRRIRRPVPWTRVPEEFGARGSELWVESFDLLNIARSSDWESDDYTADQLKPYIVGEVTYERVDPPTA